jgi:predicted thioredoxin/glutaredoxin
LSELPEKAIVVTDTCPICADVKEHLQKKGLTGKVRLINASTPEGLEFAKKHNITGVPECVLVNKDGTQVKVCNRDEFDKLLTDGT